MGFVDKHWLFWRVLVENMSMWMILQGDEFAISSNMKILINVYNIIIMCLIYYKGTERSVYLCSTNMRRYNVI